MAAARAEERGVGHIPVAGVGGDYVERRPVHALEGQRGVLGEEGAWVESRREMLRKARLRALDCLAEIHMSTGERALALRAAEEAIELEPFREAGYRRLMLVHEASGNPAEALRVYAKLEALLEAELSTGPGPETRQLFHAVANRAG